jgi:hypothetical protein
MASLYEYFIKNGASNLTMHKTMTIKTEGEVIEAIGRLHVDFEAGATYVSYYIPNTTRLACPEAVLLNSLPEVLNLVVRTVEVSAGFGGEVTNARDLVFTGLVYLYSERSVAFHLMEAMLRESKAQNHNLVFRSQEYAELRNKMEKPRAFISHDSRDKEQIAQPLALELQKRLCPVWYDEFSLRVGDSLRESIEAGLKECPKCVLVLTPSFLQKGGWSKREYDTIFTRELVEGKRLILPVWHEVTPKDVYEYSPILADRVGVPWSNGVETVAAKLIQALGV